MNAMENKPQKKAEMRHLKVLVEVESTTICWSILLFLLGSFFLLLCACHDTSLLVITNTLLEEVGLASKRDVFHEVEWVADLVVLLVSKRQQETISNELDVLLHEICVHAEQSTWKSFSQEFLLDADSLSDDVLNGLLAWSVLKVREEQACKVSVHTLVSGDELVGEGEPRHETTLLQPEDGCE